MTDKQSDNNNSSSLELTVGRIENGLNTLIESFKEFKLDHKGDITLLHTLREKLEARVKILEDEAIHRKGGLLSARTLVEIIFAVIGLWFSYHMGVWK